MVYFKAQTDTAMISPDPNSSKVIYISKKEAAYLALKINNWLGYKR